MRVFELLLPVVRIHGVFGSLAAQAATLSIHVPNSPTLLGANLYAQTVQFDSGALFDISFSRGLRLTFGN